MHKKIKEIFGIRIYIPYFLKVNIHFTASINLIIPSISNPKNYYVSPILTLSFFLYLPSQSVSTRGCNLDRKGIVEGVAKTDNLTFLQAIPGRHKDGPLNLARTK